VRGGAWLLALAVACRAAPPSGADSAPDTGADTAAVVDTATSAASGTGTGTDTGSATGVDSGTDSGADADSGGLDTGQTLPDAPRDLCDPACAGACEALPAADGNLYCVAPEAPWVHACDPSGEPLGECCDDTECGDGVCAAFSVGYCGGAAPPEVNACRVAECVTDQDCGEGRACLPAGAFGTLVATCVDADCSADADCADRPDGRCDVLSTGTCGEPRGFHCTDSDDPCRSDADCPQDMEAHRCLPTEDRSSTRCVPAPALP
jgi:hypothetical protein